MNDLSYLVQHHLIRSAKKNPNKTALIMNDCQYTYEKLYLDSVMLSNAFKKQSLSRHDRVLIQSGNSYLTLISFWAALMCDAIPCIIDPEISEKVVSSITNKIQPAISIPVNSHFKNVSFEGNPQKFNNTENDLAMIMHTSGSTGEPKGVMLSHRNVTAAMESILQYLCLTKDDVILSVLPMHFDYGLYQMLLAFSLGATLILNENCLFPNLIAHQIEKYHATVVPCVPLLVQLFYTLSQRYRHDFSTVRIITNTGENLSEKHIQKLKSLFPKASIFSMYGLTECKRCSYVPPNRLIDKSTSIGIPMPNLEMWVQDDDGNPLPPHCEGELVISGPTVMQGYWQNQIATEQKIKIINNKKILFSGDRAEMDVDGFFYFKGRRDLIIKFKGAKLNSQEYISQILALPDVDRCYLFLNQNNSDEKKLIVCVELCEENVSTDMMRKNILSFFPVSQKPDDIYFTNRFPSLSNGKLDKHQLEIQATRVLQCI